MREIELDLLLTVRKYSRYAVGVAIVLSFAFARIIEESEITWQVVIALVARATRAMTTCQVISDSSIIRAKAKERTMATPTA
jgi:hypothetical protein